ncbi:type II toxin-antitoxin system death-on-curing family toxin [Leptospira yasudae]|uniref:Type II toxin-antitoxin system death-on-curing family toxin n=1 Tax=Leptospira yasudae TaxID=2202201 RepID=A0ABX9M1A0_9LEPT|nr:type II toxin-antitoxin system death-on-curing family toxin [Leptospira yasudae]MBW0436031.1 type II toxin-antitoxin system death-on-curing family toxin [Leptospira yasudae]RHX78755.1 type II toxin-antitoxin system death-on-curing family toxin [Leptospira yasudae]RHX89530.1 type II toxin-antitoxin system death-on-curing family toxin [Leptospira yasudae]TGM07164.1 type II toxin-antitoxin system death-on-curing family toxin [Leptospira yasudae]
MNLSSIRYLSYEEILYIHKNQIEEYGGSYGIRDKNLLESAISQPLSGFDNQEFHIGLIQKAAAYLFYLCKNHAFIDGNKRVALASALIFLDLNGVEIEDQEDSLYELTIGVADGTVSLESIVKILEKLKL